MRGKLIELGSEIVRGKAKLSKFLTDLLDPLVITWLLQHDPDKRPTALELSQSPLLPPRLEDEFFKGALKLMGELNDQLKEGQ